MLMILEEISPGKFLPVYAQVYNRPLRAPDDSIATRNNNKDLIIKAGMKYSGSAGFRDEYRIIISPDHAPVIARSNY